LRYFQTNQCAITHSFFSLKTTSPQDNLARAHKHGKSKRNNS